MLKRILRIGPWDAEPDLVTFTHAGLDCVVKRNLYRGYHLCGYVGVPRRHPVWGLKYDEPCEALRPLLERPVSMDDIGAFAVVIAVFSEGEPPPTLANCIHTHQGVTYCGFRTWDYEGDWCSGVMRSKQFTGTWWIGFDCSHAGDMAPEQLVWDGHDYSATFVDGKYRDVHYVMTKTRELAEQLAEVA